MKLHRHNFHTLYKMKKPICLFFYLFAFGLVANAQSKSIIEDLNTPKVGQGNIVIYQDEAIKNLVGKSFVNNGSPLAVTEQLSTGADKKEGSSSTPKSLIKAKGYKIRVFVGNEQQRSRNEANSRKNTIKSAYPNMEVAISYAAPVWEVRAGNFATKEQAASALAEMKARFPRHAQEFKIVESVVKVPVY